MASDEKATDADLNIPTEMSEGREMTDNSRVEAEKSMETVATETDPDIDMHLDSDPDYAMPSSPIGIHEEGVLDSSASSRASSERGTPSKPGMFPGSIVGMGDRGSMVGMADNMSTCSTNSSSSIQYTFRGRCPNRPGIMWRKGEKLEAKDFMKKWYPAKIVDLDPDEGMVLIHFEGWNQRYDDWVKMTSDKLRPKMRHSERKEQRKRLSGEYKLGEHVYARWTDCKMYPGKVTGVQSDGSYEVVFYDGFKKSVQPINIRPMPTDVKQQKIEIIHVLPKEVRRKSNEEAIVVSSTIPCQEETFVETEGKVGGRRRKSHLVAMVHTELDDPEPKPEQQVIVKVKPRKPPSPERPPKRRRTTEGKPRRRDREPAAIRKRSASATVSKKKMVIAGSFFARRERSDSDSVSGKPTLTIRATDWVPKVEPTDRVELKESTTVPAPVVAPRPAVTPPTIPPADPISVPSSPASTVSVSVTPPATPATPKLPAPLRLDQPSGDVPITSVPSNTFVPSIKREKKAKKRTASPSMSETSSASETQMEMEAIPSRKRSRSTEKERALPGTPSQTPPVTSPVLPALAPVLSGVPKKAFIIEQDHNHFKCVFDGCNKAFRKENLLDSHIKYYHCDDRKHGQPAPPRKRRKTTSICSTDSDLSSSSKQTTPIFKMRHMSADTVISTTDLSESVTVDIVEEDIDIKPVTIKHERTSSQDTMATEESIETEDELSKDEVVNCICLFNEENGLMIQCDVCLCWQHAVCFDLTVETLPKKYICFVCSDPTGVRESCRYIHEQDWIKNGNQTRFGFLPNQEQDDKRPMTIQATNNLVADLHNINTVLHSLKEEIKISRDPGLPEFKIWRTDLDSEEMCPEDSEPASFSVDSRDQSSLMTDSETNQSQSLSHIDSLQNDQSQTTIQSHDQSEEKDVKSVCDNLISNTDNSSGGKVGPIEIKIEPMEITDVSGEIVRTSNLSDASKSANLVNVEDSNKVSNIPASHSTENAMSDEKVCPVVKIKVEVEENCDEVCPGEAVVAHQEDPFQACERNLLEHILRVQTQIDSRLDMIEDQVEALELAETSRGDNPQPSPQLQNVLTDLPTLRKSLHMLQSDLVKVKRMAAYHR